LIAILIKPFLPKTAETFYKAFNFEEFRPWEAVRYDDAISRPEGPDLRVTADWWAESRPRCFPKIDLKAASA